MSTQTSCEEKMKSVRVGATHFWAFKPTDESAPELRTTPFATINRAKKESRAVGGAGFVRAFKKSPGEAEIKRLLGIAS